MAKILIIDDAGFSRHMLGRIVGAVGHQIIEAENGEEGLTKILEEKPDLVLSDLLMPVMSGEELLAVLKEKQVDIPVIIMTSGDDSVAFIRGNISSPSPSGILTSRKTTSKEFFNAFSRPLFKFCSYNALCPIP